MSPLLRALRHDVIDREGLLLLSTNQIREWESVSSEQDAVDVEATMNKRYVIDLVGNIVRIDDRAALMECGRTIMQVWVERIALRFPERDVRFYLGGSESVILRFHVRGPGVADWVDVTDREFLSRSSIEVYELRRQRLEKF